MCRVAAIGVPQNDSAGRGPKLPPMHGMVSASILIAVFAAIALAGLYVAIRIHLAGATRRKTGKRQVGERPMDEGTMDQPMAQADQEAS